MIFIEEKWENGLLEGVDYVQDGTMEYYSGQIKNRLESNFNQHNQEREILFKQSLQLLSTEAMEVVSLVINTPTELLSIVLQKDSPRLTKTDLKVFLRSKGWKFKNIFSAFLEIKNFFISDKKCVIMNMKDVNKSFTHKPLNKEELKMGKDITMKKLKEYAKTLDVKGYSGLKAAELKKVVMDKMAGMAQDKKWRNDKKNQEMINWFNAEVDAGAKAEKKEDVAKDKGKKKEAKDKAEKKESAPDFKAMDQKQLITFAGENLDKLGIKKKKVKGMTEKKLRKVLTKAFGSIQSAKEKADKAKSKASDKKKEKKTKGPGVIATIFDTIASAKKPVTKKDIHKVLVKTFPERDPDAMKKTINAQIGGRKQPTRLEKSKKATFKIKDNGYMLKKK